MRSVVRTGRRIAVGATVLSVVAGGTALAVSAATEDPVPQIHACVSRGLLGIGKGTIRVVAANTTCTSGEDALSWNQQGVRGPIGPTGPTGPVGPVGATGVQGAVGPVGPGGPVGATGATGAVGPAGVSGYQQVTGAEDIGKGAFIQVRAACPQGKVVVSGGYSLIDPTVMQVWGNGPDGPGSWSVRFRNVGSETKRVTVTATCVAAG